MSNMSLACSSYEPRHAGRLQLLPANRGRSAASAMLDTALDVAHGVEILLQLGAISRTDVAVELGDPIGHRVEETAVLAESG